MKIPIVILILIASALSGIAQDLFTEAQIKEKSDSILKEGDLLYRYEKVAWVSTDIALENKKIKKKIRGYITYQKNDTLINIVLDKKGKCIFESIFYDNHVSPDSTSFVNRELTMYEQKLLKTKNKIINQIADKEYNVICPRGFSLNFVLLPCDTGYKLYILTGTHQTEVIPFGNDYIFQTDEEGKVLSWRKFHSRLIPAMTKMSDGANVTSVMHSHLRSEPFISATDICTFKLYGPLYGLKEFSVYSPALSRYFTYNLTEDTIEISEK